MKKLKSFICMLVLMCSAICLYACKGKDDKATLTSATTNLKEFYYITESIDWTDVKVTAKYSNKSTKTLSKGEFDIPVEDAKEDTEWVLNTNGLKDEIAGELTAKEYDFVLYIVGNETSYPFIVTVDENESRAFELGRFELPQNIQTFNHNISTNANGFKTTQNAKYYVGDDNPFDITPVYDVYKIGTNDDYDININLDVEVFESNTQVGDEVYSYADGKIDFTENAIGNTYTIKIKPKYFNQTRTGNYIQTLSFEVTVQDGYNAYDAYDLGMISIAPEGVNYSMYYKSTGPHDPDHNKLYYNAETNTYYNETHNDVWQRHLKNNGYDDEDIYYIKGIFLHNDIDVKDEYLPAQYFITEKESSGGIATGRLRDWVFPYAHVMQDEFTMEGNYFTVSSESLSVNGGIGFGSNRILSDYSKVSSFGHSKLFSFLGISTAINGNYESNQKTATVKNVNTIGNTGDVIGKSDAEVREAAGGIIMFQNISCPAVVDNIVIRNAMIGWFVERTDSDNTVHNFGTEANAQYDYNPTTNKAHKQSTIINNTVMEDCFSGAIFSWAGEGGCDITNSVFNRFGGPALFAVTYSDKDGKKILGADYTYDESNVTINNWLEGGEAWFVINKATPVATQLKGLNNAFSQVNKTFLNDEKFNLKVLVMDSGYLSATTANLYSKVNDYDMQDSTLLDVTSQGSEQETDNVKVTVYPPFIWTNANQNNQCYTNGTYLLDITQKTPKPISTLDGDEVFIMYRISDKCSAGIVMEMQAKTPQA